MDEGGELWAVGYVDQGTGGHGVQGLQAGFRAVSQAVRGVRLKVQAAGLVRRGSRDLGGAIVMAAVHIVLLQVHVTLSPIRQKPLGGTANHLPLSGLCSLQQQDLGRPSECRPGHNHSKDTNNVFFVLLLVCSDAA